MICGSFLQGFRSNNFVDTCEDLLKKGDVKELQSLFHNLHQQLFDEIIKDGKVKLNPYCIFPIDWLHTLVNSSDAECYSPIWSRVMSSDIYNERIKNKSLNKNIGCEIIDKIFKQGGLKPSYDMICDYIGRKPAIDGFISMHSLDTDVEYSFFLKTENLNKNEIIKSDHSPFEYYKQTIGEETQLKDESEVESQSNKFSEINESSVQF